MSSTSESQMSQTPATAETLQLMNHSLILMINTIAILQNSTLTSTAEIGASIHRFDSKMENVGTKLDALATRMESTAIELRKVTTELHGLGAKVEEVAAEVAEVGVNVACVADECSGLRQDLVPPPAARLDSLEKNIYDKLDVNFGVVISHLGGGMAQD